MVVLEVHDSSDVGDLGLLDITSRFIEHHAEEMDRKVTPKWFGGIIRRRLGLRTERRGGSYVIPMSEAPRLEQLYERYGLASAQNTPEEPAQDIAKASGFGGLNPHLRFER